MFYFILQMGTVHVTLKQSCNILFYLLELVTGSSFWRCKLAFSYLFREQMLNACLVFTKKELKLNINGICHLENN